MTFAQPNGAVSRVRYRAQRGMLRAQYHTHSNGRQGRSLKGPFQLALRITRKFSFSGSYPLRVYDGCRQHDENESRNWRLNRATHRADP